MFISRFKFHISIVLAAEFDYINQHEDLQLTETESMFHTYTHFRANIDATARSYEMLTLIFLSTHISLCTI